MCSLKAEFHNTAHVCCDWASAPVDSSSQREFEAVFWGTKPLAAPVSIANEPWRLPTELRLNSPLKAPSQALCALCIAARLLYHKSP
jgi:hypothetical protein